MNEQDRQELQNLKLQQRLLQEKLSQLTTISADLTWLSHRIAQLEQRLEAEGKVATPAGAKAPVTSPEITPPTAKQNPIVPLPNQPNPSYHSPSQAVPIFQEPKKPAPQEPTPPLLPPLLQPTQPASETVARKKAEPEKPKVPVLAAAPTTQKAAQPPPVPPPVIPQAPAPGKGSFELRLGTFWLVRIGIVMLLTGLVFLANLAYKNWVLSMGPGGKVTLLYLAGAALLGVGGWLYHKFENLKNYAQVLLAGGLAEVYFTTYAAHHFPFLRVIQSPILDALLLMAWAGCTVALADWKKSEVLALFAIVLSYYNGIITNVGLFTLYSNLILAIAATVFLIRNRWAGVSTISLVATYAAYAFWRFFRGGEWHWASPEEGLWTGNYFLMCYWCIFTAAVFLSRKEQLSGKHRATFLTLNNGAFFALFILTMLQVQTGGFWKVCLSFGSVLIGLAILARLIIAKEELASNAYLTQGLLLVTLGFITHFTGTSLPVILAVESVGLLLFSRQWENQVLRIGSFICAALVTTFALGNIKAFDRSGLIMGASTGLLLLFNAWRVDSPVREQPAARAPEKLYFTALGLLIWLLTSWQNTSMEWRGLALGAESVVFLLAGRLLPTLGFGSWAFAGVATAAGVFFMIEQIDTRMLAERTGLYPYALLGALMIGNALLEQRARSEKSQDDLHTPSFFFSALGLAVWLATTCAFTAPRLLAVVLAVEALLFTLSLPWLKLPGVVLFGQLFLLVAHLQCVISLLSPSSLPWWNAAIVIIVTLAVSHWWQRHTVPAVVKEIYQLCLAAYPLAIVAVLYFWLRLSFGPDTWLAFTTLLALGLTAYGLLTRLWFLAGFGQLFLLLSIFEFTRQLGHRFLGTEPAWYYALAPIFALWIVSQTVLLWWKQKSSTATGVGDTIARVGIGYRVIAALLSLAWVFHYVNERNRFWVLVLLGGVFFLSYVVAVRRSRPSAFASLEVPLIGAGFTLIGFGQYWTHAAQPSVTVYFPSLLAILFLFVQQQIARRKGARLGESLHTGIILLGACTLWLFVSQFVRLQSGGVGFYLTASWAGLALLIFIAGFVLHERVYRWAGLGILAAALGRVMLLDVRHLELIYRIFSFMALGIVLLVLGFIYNKYQEKIRQWL